MNKLAQVFGMLSVAAVVGSVMAQDNPCTAGGKNYDSGTNVCMRGFIQQCVNGAWVNQQRFCSEDEQLEVIREPGVAVPGVGGANQPGEPPVQNPSDVAVPPAQP
jgi:hypothetical protein